MLLLGFYHLYNLYDVKSGILSLNFKFCLLSFGIEQQKTDLQFSI